MTGKHYFSIIVAMVTFCIAPLSCQQAPTQSNKCLEDFSNTFRACCQEAGIQLENILWFVTNGTSSKSQAPANPDSFKTQVCNVQQQIGSCTFQRIAPIMNSTACIGTSASTSQQAAVGNQLTTIFGTFDLKCMHPCRNTLPTDLRNCYSDSGLDPKLFLSNSTNGAVIGSTTEQVTLFCGAKDALIKCMQSKVDACPESAQIMRAIDLDVPSFQKGVTVLCNHPDVYLHGLKCFAETTPDIDRCKQKETQSFIQMDSQARAGNWSEQRFSQEYCQISITQIECDLDSWSKKNHEACTPVVIGLRRELECTLIPSQCNLDPKQISQVEHACHPEKFSTEARSNFAGGSSAVSVLISSGLILVSLGLSSATIL